MADSKDGLSTVSLARGWVTRIALSLVSGSFFGRSLPPRCHVLAARCSLLAAVVAVPSSLPPLLLPAYTYIDWVAPHSSRASAGRRGVVCAPHRPSTNDPVRVRDRLRDRQSIRLVIHRPARSNTLTSHSFDHNYISFSRPTDDVLVWVASDHTESLVIGERSELKAL
jgi:hypothetical protein